MGQIEDRRTFGVASLAFEWLDQSSAFTLREWVEAVREALEAVATVDNIQIDTGYLEVGLDFTLPARGLDAEEALVAAPFHPEPVGVSISFDVRVPQRFHAAYTGGPNLSEDFHVDLQYAYWCPVAFVTCVDAPTQHQRDGSMAVVIVRKYLAETLAQQKLKHPIGLTTLGPSPFHADFLLAPRNPVVQPDANGGAADARDVLSVMEGDREGYRDWLCTYDAQQIDVIEAECDLQYALRDEFSLFYELIRRKNARMRRAIEADRMVGDLIGLHSQEGLRGVISRVFKSGGAARLLGVFAMRARLSLQSDKAFAAEQVRSVAEETRTKGVAVNEIQEAASRHYEAEIDNALAIVNFLEAARSKEFEVAVVAASTIGGALAGAVAAILLT